MYFESFSDFLAMGQHGFYVWLAYGAAFLIFAYNLLAPYWAKRTIKKQLQKVRV